MEGREGGREEGRMEDGGRVSVSFYSPLPVLFSVSLSLQLLDCSLVCYVPVPLLLLSVLLFLLLLSLHLQHQ